MIALVVIGLIAVIAIGVVWSRVGLARSERRSMREYKHGLEVLGGVSRRSTAPARSSPRQQLPPAPQRSEPRPPAAPGTVARPPLNPAIGGPGAFTPPPPRPRIPAPKSFSSVYPPPRTSITPPPSGTFFEDDSDAFEQLHEQDEKTTVIPLGGAGAKEGVRFERADPARRRTAPDGRASAGDGSRLTALAPIAARVGTMGAVAVVLLVISLLAVHLASAGSPRSATGTTVGARTGAVTRHHRHHPRPSTPTTTPSALIPVSTSPTQVAFVAPKGSYTVQMSDTGGVCWIGIQQTSGGPYVWQDTLYAGQTTTYKASGPLVIRIGAPKYLGVKVNGLPARLPGFVQPYDVVFNPATPPSSA